MFDDPVGAPVEADLLQPLVHWLRVRRQIREDSIVIKEFPWHGRRVDLAVLTASGRTSAFELKLAHNRRAIEQSYLNGAAFERCYLVTATPPSALNAAQALSLGLGIIQVSPTSGGVSLLQASRRATIDPRMSAKLRHALARRGGADV